MALKESNQVQAPEGHSNSNKDHHSQEASSCGPQSHTASSANKTHKGVEKT